MIAIIDYGMGNLRSVQKGFERVGVTAIITDDANKLADADAIVLPGVGAFSAAMRRLEEANLVEAIRREINAGKPYLGICLGLQLLFTESEEGGRHFGLDIIPGNVVRFPTGLKVPHIGWNELEIKKDIPLLKDIPQKSYLYFVHSYYVVPDDPSVIAATTNYGIDFTSIIHKDNIFATQYHPEKSQTLGLRILRNFGLLADPQGF
ncbi:imidazole glycerol phosphate synthase subunit HisH [Candidatus Poribacteria bacterium]|nr:imidazole glycerol phosphate synthase subunit HisH [Candidatus Poribacteria bacterium]